ncbi:hypothetical protein ACG2LH_09150 [Zhouia sp. PK063]|uniref:hypothetical protein n=1 Tax=Zhouia sp. PK063 TaxID=3373602 RepID=UPI0037B2170A
MKTVIQIVLWIVSAVLVYMIYNSIMGPIKFDKVKKERYKAVVSQLKDIRDAEQAYKKVTGKYTDNYDALVKFVDTANFVITSQRDSSYKYYDKTYRIDMLKEVVIVDTLGTKSVKDSLFGGTDRYKTMMNVPFAEGNEKFALKAGTIKQNGYDAPVFEAKVKKDDILFDQPQDLRDKENQMISVDEINGNEIKVGSMTEVSTSGNWPQSYDNKKLNRD